MPLTQRWSDEAATDALPVVYDEEPISFPSLRLVKFLFAMVTLAAIVASVAVALHMSDRSTASAPTVEAQPGDCLTWPPGAPERAVKVDCADEHLFEVAASTATPNPDANEQTCAQAVTRYLGSRYDPGGRFVVGMVSTPAARDGRLLCGLQLPSDGVASIGFRGRIAGQDQSRVWPAGTCLGIRGGRSIDTPVSCALPHALEIAGTTDLSTVFGQAAPSISAQDAVVRDACGATTSAYLSPAVLDAIGLTLRYQPIDAVGWDAGSRRIACRIGSPRPDGSWATLVGSAKTGVVIDGQAARPPSPPAPPPPGPPAPPAVDVAAPTTEPLQPSRVEAPVRANRDTEEPAEVTEPEPQIVDAEGPGPAAEPPPAEPLPESEPPPAG